MNETFYLFPKEINIVCLMYYYYTIDSIMNYNHLSKYQRGDEIENVRCGRNF